MTVGPYKQQNAESKRIAKANGTRTTARPPRRKPGPRKTPATSYGGRPIEDRRESGGYILLHRRAMSAEQIAVADRLGLWRDRGTRVSEHKLIAAIRYGEDYDPRTMVVRHKNGDGTDNDPGNLLIGSQLENVMDHDTARKAAMHYHQRCRELEREIAALRSRLC